MLFGILILLFWLIGIFVEVFNFFWVEYRKSKGDYTSLQQWWDVGKCRIRQLCQQYTLNVSRDRARSMRELEIELVDLQSLAESTGDRGHIEALTVKKTALSSLLGVKAQGALVRSRFMDATHMDAPSHYFFSLERQNGQRKIFHSLRTDTGATLSDPDGICRYAAGFYKELYEIFLTETCLFLRVFLRSSPTKPLRKS